MKAGSQSLRRAIPSLHSLILFEAAARFLNFSRAAAELSITQPAVSHGIRQLEASLGHALFVREQRGLSLTTQGQRLYASVSGGIASIAETIDDMSETPKLETVVLSTSLVMATEWLAPRLPRFHEVHPSVMIELRSLDRDPELVANNIDLHLRLGDGNWSGYEACALWPEKVLPVCSPGYRAKSGEIATAGDLMDHSLIHYVDPYRYRMGWPEWFRAVDVSVPSMLPAAVYVNDSLLAMRAAENGEGIALGWPPVIDRALAAGRLVVAHDRVVETGRSFYSVTTGLPNRRRLAIIFQDWLLNQVVTA